MRAVFYELAETGSLSQYPRATEGGLVIEGGARGARGVAGLRGDVCAYWRKHGFGPEFWWSD